MGSKKGTARRVSVTATALTAGLAWAALAAVATGMVSIGTWVPGSGGDDTQAELAGSRSRVGDGYGDRGDLLVATQDSRLDPTTGAVAGEWVLGIDVRPANGLLYRLGSTNQIYTIDPPTAVATAVGVPFSAEAFGRAVGFDVNPVVDRLRVVTSSGQNLRIVPDTGAVAAVTKPLAFAVDDRSAKARARVTHAAYTNGFVGATSTTLFDIDTSIDVLSVQAPPKDGVLRTTGKLAVNVDPAGGFDIAADGAAIAALSRSGGSRVYAIDLESGKTRVLGKLGRGSTLTSLAVAPRGV